MIWCAFAMVAPSMTSAEMPPNKAAELTSVKGEAGIDLGGNPTRDDLQNFRTESNQQSVHGVLRLLFGAPALLFTEFDGGIDDCRIVGEFGCCQTDKRESQLDS